MAILHRSKRLKKELTLLDVYAIATGATLSSGFFLLPGLAVMEAGPALVLAYMIAAIPLIPATLSIAELATAMPRAGGAYYFLDRSMGPLLGTVGGLGTWFALVLKTAFALIGMGAYVGLLFDGVSVVPLAAALAVLFGVVNLTGAKRAGAFQVVLVMVLLVILGWFMGGVTKVRLVHFAGFFDRGFAPIFATAGLVYISYVGVTSVASVSEEIREPEKNLPRGLFLALATAICVYSIGTFVMVGVVGPENLHGDLTPAATTARSVYGSWGVRLITGAAILAFASVANAGILSASRYPLAMSRDHLLPAFLRTLNRRGLPTWGVACTVGLILVFICLFDPTGIAKLASAFQLLMFGLLCLAVIVMRESRIESYDPAYRSPFYPWMQILGVCAPVFLIAQMGWFPVLFSIAVLAAGTAWYLHYGRARVRREGAVYHVFERLGGWRDEGLDTELRGILKEKGLREGDPFDDTVARACVIDVVTKADFQAIAREAARLLAGRVPVAADHILEGFMRGTRVGATPVARGAALPHLRLHGVPGPEMVLARARSGVRIDVVDQFGEELPHDEPVHALFFLVSADENPGQHLRILAQVAGRVDDDDFMHQWLAARDEQELKEVLLRDEYHLSLSLEAGSKTEGLIGRVLHELDFPEGCLIAIIRRGHRTFVPRGNTTLRTGDRLTIIGAPEGIRRLHDAYC